MGKPATSKTGIYVHIPFCQAICNYCNFNRGLHDPGLRERYVDALVTDIRRSADPSVEADTIFFGGGTPSLLAPSELGRIIQACRDSFEGRPFPQVQTQTLRRSGQDSCRAAPRGVASASAAMPEPVAKATEGRQPRDVTRRT